MAGKPNLTLEVKNKIVRPGAAKAFWAPCGRVTLWQDGGGRWSGKLMLNIFGTEYHLFEADALQGAKPQQEEPAPLTDADLPI